MITKTKVFRVNYSTWRELRHFFPGKRGESVADYVQRFIDYVITTSEISEQNEGRADLRRKYGT